MNKELEIIKQNQQLVIDLCQYIKNNLGYEKDPVIYFAVNKKNSEDPLGKTAYYVPEECKVCVYISNRHIKDVLRSLAHELIHHAQNCRGEFNNNTTNDTVDGYAQSNQHLRKMEEEAYLKGNMLFRDWSDNFKYKK